MSEQPPLKLGMYLHRPVQFSHRSGMLPLVEALEGTPIFYDRFWRRLRSRSWTLGEAARHFGNWYYGSEWNGLFPLIEEWQLARKTPGGLDVAHFLWGEFAGPSWPGLFRRKARRLVGTFHASARKQPTVLKRCRTLRAYDAITLMSESQRPWFEAQGIPSGQIRVILHGVDTRYFKPGPRTARDPAQPLRGLLVGYTERDHAFMAEILKRLPAGVLQMTILAPYDQKVLNYSNVPHAVFPRQLSDDELRAAYQQADLIVMPMMDCSANNVILESMACGTPVMVNRVGGIGEYVEASCNWVMTGKNLEEWIEVLVQLARDPAPLEAVRPKVRAWAERFDWHRVAPHYLELYRELLR